MGRDVRENVKSELLRRVVFFARYEASNVGAERIEWPHLFLALMREGRPLLRNFLGSHQSVVGLRLSIEENMPARPRVSTSVDIPMPAECMNLIEFADRQTLGHRRPEAPLEVLFVSMLKTQPDWFRKYGLDGEAVAAAFPYPAVNPPTVQPLEGVLAMTVQFRGALDEMETALRPMPETRAGECITKDGISWSRKQLVGFLIDSASNQHQLGIRALVSDEPEVSFPDYDPAVWVRATGYQETSWRVLTDLCVTYHRLLYDLINRYPPERLSRVSCRVGTQPPRSLGDLLAEYVKKLGRNVRDLPS